MTRPVVMFVTGGERLLSSGQTPENIVLKLVSLSVAWAKAGVDIVQIREPWLPDRVLLKLVTLVVARLSAFNTKVVVNDRLDVALAGNADGIHLKDEPLDMDRVRKLAAKDWLIGRSVHDVRTAEQACRGGHVDYVLAGTVKSSPSKQGRKLLGLNGLEEIAAAVDVPVIAIGGLGFSDALRIGKTAAAGLAGIRLFMSGEKLTDDQRFRQIAQCRGAFGSN